MGKIKKKFERASRQEALDQQIIGSRYAKPSTRIKQRSRRDEDEEFVDSKLTHKILEQARKQQEDLEEEVGLSLPHSSAAISALLSGCDSLEETQKNGFAVSSSADGFKEVEKIEISQEDEKALEMFMPHDPSKRAALADIMKEKLTEKQTEMSTIFPDSSNLFREANPEMITVFRDCAKLLSLYRAGPLPKPIKALPQFANWEQLLNLTEPDKWTAAAMMELTRIFSSNLSAKMAQRFYNKLLLPRLRDDISEYKKLNDHLYKALIQALFKPSAFYKGIIIPLCEFKDPDIPCSQYEAKIIGSVIAKHSIPILDSGAAILVLSQMDYTGAACYFLKILVEKKYALPFKVIGAVVQYFMKFEKDERTFPKQWHECLLSFVKIYKNDLSSDQQTDLLRLIGIHSHDWFTAEIHKELLTRKNQTSEQSVIMSE
ncbi:bystin [Parasteatoda tepidariorum]|uniref:bystin n=1 Tax=Parasteatoda tepidariorum TaxID=114398 RepID=UPI001C72277A|nr:bystin [Parasteatoda tepidariorum]